ncbi:MAG TPA: ATP-binding protein [Stenomitos sp.]
MDINQKVDFDYKDLDTQEALATLATLFPNLKLNNIQIIVFVDSWRGKTYQQISESQRYDADYLKDVGHRLWKQLGEILQVPLSKHNFRSVLKEQIQRVNAHQPPLKRLEYQENSVVSGPPEDSIDTAAAGPVVDVRQVTELPVFWGRDAELLQLEQLIIHRPNRLVGIFGLGGVGKTVLVMQLIQKIEAQFEFVIARSLRNTPEFESFLESILSILQGDTFTRLPPRLDDQVSLLIDYLSKHRCLLIFDDWLSLLEPQNGLRSYRAQYEFYGFLLRQVSESKHKSCVVITSRETPHGLAFKDNQSFPVSSLSLSGFTLEDGLAYLQEMNLSATQQDLEKLLWRYSANPYALSVVSKTIKNIFDGNVANFLSKNMIIYGEIRQLIEQQFERLSNFEKNVIYNITNITDLQPDAICPLNELEESLDWSNTSLLIESLESLYHRSFISWQGKGIAVPQILKEYIQWFYQDSSPLEKLST